MLDASRFGAGQTPVLLLHGFLGSQRNLRSLARALGRARPDLNLIAADLPGHGASAAALPRDAELADMARVLLDFADAAALDRFSIVGHSLGGRAALMMRRLAPERLERIVLLDITPAPIIRSPDLNALLDVLGTAPERAEARSVMRAHFGQRIPKSLVEWVLMNLERKDDVFAWRIDRSELRNFGDRANTEDLWDTIDDAVDCIYGTRSDYVDEGDQAKLIARGCSVTSVDAGHFVHINALPDVVAAISELTLG